MSDLDEEGGELSPEAKAFLNRHQATGEPSKEELELGLQRLSAPLAAKEAKVLPLRRKRPLLPPEVLAAAAVVTILLGAQAAYLVLRPKPEAPKKARVVSGSRELAAISAAWTRGDYEQVKRLASQECASDECRPLATELSKMLERAEHPDRLTPEQREELLRFDLELSEGKTTALSRQLIKPAPEEEKEQLARGEQLFNEARVEWKAKNFSAARPLLEKCVATAPAYYPCFRLLGSVYASIATRDQSALSMEKARRMYELFLEVAPADDEYVPKVRAILDSARGAEAPASRLPPELVLVVSQARVLQIAGISRVAIGDPAIADVKTVGTDELVLTGVAPGKTTLLVWTSDGKRSDTVLDVRASGTAAPRPEPEPGPEVAAEEQAPIYLAEGAQTSLSFDRPMTRVAVGDPEIADLSVGVDQLGVKGVHAGTTTVLVWLEGGSRKEVLVTVLGAEELALAKVFQQAKKARAAGDWLQAVTLARKVVAREPNHPGARALLEAAREEASEAYLRGYQLRDHTPDEARRLFTYVMALTSPDDALHQKAKTRLAELAP